MSDYPVIDEHSGRRAQQPGGLGGHGGSGGNDPPHKDPQRQPILAVGAASLLGAIFSALSTSDFVNHLDRQVHSIHCSFIPGAAAELGESGCRTVMMSPYSSVLRSTLWGGIPLSLLAMAVFAYLVFRALHLAFKPELSRKDTTFLLAATGLPLGMSVIMGFVALMVLGATCKLCVGVYVASAVAFAGALVAHLRTPADSGAYDPGGASYGMWFAEGVIFVVALVALYVLAAPANDKSAKGCGTLARKEDSHGVFVPMGKNRTGTPAIAVLDPLCPACKAFDDRLSASGQADELALNVVLFPLDATCNWMVKESMHPGACAVSEAMLCAKDQAETILAYAFEHQEELRNEAQKDDARLRQRLESKFPAVKGCLGSSAIKNKVNKSLRWAVSNALPVLTPQLFIGDRRMCDEDTDLGLEFTVARMVESARTKKARR